MAIEWKMINLVFSLCVALTIGLSIGYYLGQTIQNPLLNITYLNLHHTHQRSPLLGVHVNVIDLHTKILSNFTCMKLKKLLDSFETSVCIYDVRRDIYVSGTIVSQKIWEENFVTKFVTILNKYPEYAMIDVGANIGVYTLYALALHRPTISVECYKPNIERIVRASQIENVSKHLTLIGNAIYNRSGEFFKLSKDDINVGGQGLTVNGTMQQASSMADQFTVSTIRFDDLLPLFIDRQIENAIMKVDIQSSENFLCASGEKIFDSINIPFILMEWVDIKWITNRADFIIDFFIQRSYFPVSTYNCQILNHTTSNYTTWGTPHDIYWIKSNYYHLCRL
ncbi:unnamed protein product [Adineta ricciae]|uniref:Methyltransferase FkbM domain-containing protein n=1 Tax=Adineta ricciae TaxID=249248 RepID=A0A815W130_ADIRI|nr:unnamed protein product [Adineta ricciae]